MTINVALVTNEAVIFGCDSVASTTGLYLNPLPLVQVDGQGKYVTDGDGKFEVKFTANDLQSLVTDAWGGVTKMFRLSGDDNPIAGVTAGLAQLNGRTISAVALEFLKTVTWGENDGVRAIVDRFVEFMGKQYEEHYGGKGTFRTDIEFLVGGVGRNDRFPSLYRVNLIKDVAKRVEPLYGPGEEFSDRSGIAWSGQSDGVQRLLFGYDNPIRHMVEAEVGRVIDELHREMSDATLRILRDTLAALERELPPGLNTELPQKPKAQFDWNQCIVSMDFANLPIQSAVELVSYLVNVQSGKSKFVKGVPTVGGRTHIGIITRDGFVMLNEPEITHRNTGYD